MITDYQVVETREADDLKLEVDRLIREGWQPFGSVAVCADGQSRRYCQAMVVYGYVTPKKPDP